jgi:endonuclease/exonuclease/phosphatase family metal-dependent hydrolase
MTTPRTLLIGALAVSAVLVGAASLAARPAAAYKVYTANVENLLTKKESCPGDWHELVHWISGHSVPDLILLQQVDGEAQTRAFTDRLNELHSQPDFSFIVAERNPDGTERCNGEKRRQTNAIVWNTVNLTLLPGTVDTWQSVHQGSDPDTQCEPSPQSRTLNLKAAFAEGVSAASVHWPTVASGGKGCDDSNARLTDSELKEPAYASSARQIVGGDLNVTADKDWYGEMGSRGFRDAMAGNPTWTHILDDGAGAKRRIDYLLARVGTSGPASFDNPYTVTFAMAHEAQEKVDPDNTDPASCNTYPKAPEKAAPTQSIAQWLPGCGERRLALRSCVRGTTTNRSVQ